MTRKGRTLLWLAANVFGAACYLYFAARVWPEPELRGTEYAVGPGTPFLWALSALPILMLCALVDGVVVVIWCIAMRRSAEWRPSALAWLIPVIWLVACGIDRAHY